MLFANPRANVRQFRVPFGAKIADFGAGTGCYTELLSDYVGGSGHVYAIDIISDLLGTLRKKALVDDRRNIETIWSDLERPYGAVLRDGSVDAVLVSNLLFEVSDRNRVASEAYRITRSGGKVLSIEWKDSFGGIGPPRKRIVSEQGMRSLFESRGFRAHEPINAGDYHYGLVFVK